MGLLHVDMGPFAFYAILPLVPIIDSIVMGSILCHISTYIPESVQLMFNSSGAFLVCTCTEKTSPQREAFCPKPCFCHQKYTTNMQPNVNLPLHGESFRKAGSRLPHVWQVFAVQQKTKWAQPFANRISTSPQNGVGISVKIRGVGISVKSRGVTLLERSQNVFCILRL